MDRPKLLAQTSDAKRPSIYVLSDIKSEQKPQVSIRMFPQFKSQQIFTLKQEFVILKDCRRLPILSLSFVSERTGQLMKSSWIRPVNPNPTGGGGVFSTPLMVF